MRKVRCWVFPMSNSISTDKFVEDRSTNPNTKDSVDKIDLNTFNSFFFRYSMI